MVHEEDKIYCQIKGRDRVVEEGHLCCVNLEDEVKAEKGVQHIAISNWSSEKSLQGCQYVRSFKYVTIKRYSIPWWKQLWELHWRAAEGIWWKYGVWFVVWVGISCTETSNSKTWSKMNIWKLWEWFTPRKYGENVWWFAMWRLLNEINFQ